MLISHAHCIDLTEATRTKRAQHPPLSKPFQGYQQHTSILDSLYSIDFSVILDITLDDRVSENARATDNRGSVH